MDQLYNHKDAAEALEILATEAHDGKHRDKYLSVFNTDEGLHNISSIARLGSSSGYCLVKSNGIDSSPEEIVLCLHGILVSLELPPVFQLPRHEKSIKDMQQAVMVTGLSTAKFMAALGSVMNIHNMFARQATRGDLKEWLPGCLGGHQTVTIGNKYFRYLKGVMNVDRVPFSPHVDPNGVLASVPNSRLVHTEDNDVQYFERVKRTDKSYRYAVLSPSQFSIGDIVEVQLSFKMIIVPEVGARMMLLMRSLALVDSSFSKAWKIAQMEGALRAPAKQIKRRALYEEDETADEEAAVAASRKAMVNLSMNEGAA